MSILLQNPAWAALVALLVKATALVCVAATAQFLLRRRASAATRHGVWALTVAGLLLLPPLALTGPQWPVQIAVPASQAAVARAQPTPSTPATASAATSARGDFASTATAATAVIDRAAAISWPAIALAVYVAGVLLLAVRLVADHLAARRLVRASERILDEEWTAAVDAAAKALGVTKPVRLLRAPAQAMPMVVGLRRPAILVSNDADAWTAERRRSVILHEMAHVQRRDCFTQTLASLARALYWPHPGVWWAARRLQVEREFACDDRVLALGTEANGYANDLLEIAYSLGARRAPALAVTMARRGQLEGRLLAVLDAARNRATPGLIGRAAAALVAASVIVPVAAIGIRTEAASLPIEGNIGISSGAVGRLDEPVTAPHRKDSARQPGRLAPALYSWADVVEQAFSTNGTWSVQPSEKSGEVYFEMRQLHSSNGHTVPLSQLEGLTTAQMNAGGTVKFLLRRDAGSFACEGVFRDGVGGGAFTYAANPAFADELAKRGVARPSARQQFEMAKSNLSLALVDDLRAQGYQTPTPDQLVQAGHHGVTGGYVREMGALGYKVGTIDALIALRDHGVSPDYVQGMLAEGLPKMSADDLVRTRDHGVTPEYVRALRGFGFGSLSVDEIVNARDHGVSAAYVTSMHDLGYKLTLGELVTARDHGVSADYVKDMKALGFTLTVDELRNARDHGVTPDYVRAMQGLGYKASLGEMIQARDHGVTPDYVKQLSSVGYDKLALEKVIQMRDRGVTAEMLRK
jgi:beta-lactamase regulating signal transducer with metallopeptidase domain/ribosomal protein L7Ae-like RNA K-turn-binding protein